MKRIKTLGPGQFNFDASILKTTRIPENTMLQFRAGFFNWFNHPHFEAPDVNSGTAGTLAFLPNVAQASITQTNVYPRVIQLGLKFLFSDFLHNPSRGEAIKLEDEI